MSGTARATETPEKRYKTHGTDWWTPPPNMSLNAGIPYVAQVVDPDAVSLTELRVHRVITDLNAGARKQSGANGEERGYLCDPGGYGQIAQRAGICRKTAYNAVKSLERKKLLREHQLVTRGKQRVKTLYFAPHFGDALKSWRADPELFKTALGRVVVRGRRKALMTVEEAKQFNLDPIRAPKRGCGTGRSEFEQQKQETKVEPAPEPLPNDEDLKVVREAFLQCCPSNLKDAIDLIRIARAEARKMGDGVLPAAVIARLMLNIAHEYKPTPAYPEPKPKWFIDGIAAKVAYWVRWSAPREAREQNSG